MFDLGERPEPSGSVAYPGEPSDFFLGVDAWEACHVVHNDGDPRLGQRLDDPQKQVGGLFLVEKELPIPGERFEAYFNGSASGRSEPPSESTIDARMELGACAPPDSTSDQSSDMLQARWNHEAVLERHDGPALLGSVHDTEQVSVVCKPDLAFNRRVRTERAPPIDAAPRRLRGECETRPIALRICEVGDHVWIVKGGNPSTSTSDDG